MDRRREELRGKYLKLGTGELAAAVVFALVTITLVLPSLSHPRDQVALCSALAPLLIILVQAGAYWLLARNWVELHPMPARFANTYRAFRISDVALLAAGLVGVLVWWPPHLGAALLVTAVWGFGAVEYVNYFLVRLAYPAGKWFTTVGQWRVPQLMKDLRAAKQ
ncbi:hypothetical protein HC744_16885 [Arthrobacter sp. S1_S22]|nr:hypothetical protein [Arthrobacter sp. S1_S22]